MDEIMGPENKNEDGSVKTETDVVKDLKKRAELWLKTPSLCRECMKKADIQGVT